MDVEQSQILYLFGQSFQKDIPYAHLNGNANIEFLDYSGLARVLTSSGIRGIKSELMKIAENDIGEGNFSEEQKVAIANFEELCKDIKDSF